MQQWRPTDIVNPEELGEYFEGDIILTTGQEKNGLIDERYRWPNGIVPYEIREEQFSKQQNIFVRRALI